MYFFFYEDKEEGPWILYPVSQIEVQFFVGDAVAQCNRGNVKLLCEVEVIVHDLFFVKVDTQVQFGGCSC